MIYTIERVRKQLRDALENAVKSAVTAGDLPEAELPDFIFETPNDRGHGDYASNIAMVSAKAFRKAPRQIADIISRYLDLSNTYFDRCEIAGPGFINFYNKPSFYIDILRDAAEMQSSYGQNDFGQGKRVLVEFVSANPTGPMHIGNARGGALGDCLSAVLQTAGYEVKKEFYINDAGNQLEKLGLSLDIRYRQIFEGDNAPRLPEDSYHGEDIKAHAQAYAGECGDHLLRASEDERRKALTDFALPKNIAKMKNDLARYGVEYDRWFYESELHKSGEVDKVISIFKDKGLTYEKDEALWYRATDFGAEKDEVLIRSNGKPTYFAVDVAYHRNKFLRGFDRLINCWGADHHGHVARMKAALTAIGERGDMLDIVLYQLVNLVRDGQAVRMSKRTGKAIQLGDLLDEVSRDAARFTFNLHEPNVAMEFDLGLAVKEDAQNPVYYVQYAHARICSILRALTEDGITPVDCTPEMLDCLKTPEELELIRSIAAYPDEIIRAAKSLDSSVITRYTINLATLFHKFYNNCRVRGESKDLMQSRIQLCIATQTILKNALTMFSITAPERM